MGGPTSGDAIPPHPAGSPEHIRYLALEGGGGMGGAYLGAIIALEELGLLPVRTTYTRLEGIAGASAGAITAFLLALGQTSGQLWKLICGPEFGAFLDAPRSGYARRAVFAGDAPPGEWIRDPALGFESERTTLPPTFLARLLASLLRLPRISRGVRKSPTKADDLLVAAIRKHTAAYARNILRDPGIFPGFSVRAFLAKQLAARLAAGTNKSPDSFVDQAKLFTFQEFLDKTGVDLVIAGTNLSSGTPHYFSQRTTPDFSVIEAVGLSMSIPVLFKQVWIDTEDKKLEQYQGWWGDGGMLLNLPLHAFNTDRNGNVPRDAWERAKMPLKRGTLGLALDAGDLAKFDKVETAATFPNTLEIAKLALEAFLYAGTDGQVRDANERAQVVWLQAHYLQAFNLVADPLLVAATVVDCRYRVHKSLVGEMPSGGDKLPATLIDTMLMVKTSGERLGKITTEDYAAKVREDYRTKLY